MKSRFILLTLILSLALTIPACDQTPSRGCSDLIVSDAWIRSMPPGPTMTAGYLQIENHGKARVTLKGFSSPVFKRIELHETRQVDGQMQMRAIPSVQIPSGDIVAMRPGGKHLMLFEPKQTLQPGEQHKLKLHCAKGTLDVEAEVRTIQPGKAQDAHHGHH